MIYDVLEYGAKADGVTNDAAAIQKAIDDAVPPVAVRLCLEAEEHIIQAPLL